MRIKSISIIVLSILLLSGFARGVLARGRDGNNFIREYPDGNYGIDLGGGYEVAPIDGGVGQEELLLPRGYRDDYRKTKYGPMTETGFQFFPGFHFSDSAPVAETEGDFSTNVQMFNEYTTSSENSLWGVYDPSTDQ